MCKEKRYMSVTRQDTRTIPASGVLYDSGLISGVLLLPANVLFNSKITGLKIQVDSATCIGTVSMRGIALNNNLTGAFNRLVQPLPSQATNWGTLSAQNALFFMVNSYNDWKGGVICSGIDIQNTFVELKGNPGASGLVYITLTVEYEFLES